MVMSEMPSITKGYPQLSVEWL